MLTFNTCPGGTTNGPRMYYCNKLTQSLHGTTVLSNNTRRVSF